KHLGGFVTLLLGQFEELRRRSGNDACIEAVEICNEDTVEHGKQQKRILRSFTARFRLFNQRSRAKRGRSGFFGTIAPEVHERGYQRDLQLDFLSSKGRRRGQGSNLRQRATELLGRFRQRRALQRALSGL